jgi:predicted metal-dependent phosphoesterase TrpH
VDFHAHTRASSDAWTSVPAFVARAEAAGLDRIAVTDHGRMDGAFAAQALDPERVILGQEMRCREGVDLIGLFLREPIPEFLSLPESAAAIRAQGGVVYAPHPFAYLTGSARRAALAVSVADVVEVFNSRAFVATWNRRATAMAAERALPGFASSDAHFPWEIGRAWTELPPFTDAASFLAAAGRARPHRAALGSPALHVSSIVLSLVRGGRVEL